MHGCMQVCETLLPDIAWPFLAHAFGFALRDAEVDSAGAQDSRRTTTHEGSQGTDFRDARSALRVSDAFIVKYNASSGQRLLQPHRDGALFSFNVALNDLDEYTGGN